MEPAGTAMAASSTVTSSSQARVDAPIVGNIDDAALLARYLTPNMFAYFRVKLPDLSPAEIRTQIAELLKFLILVREFPGNIIFGKEIDEVWHLWVMQTRQYEELCQALPGGEIRHHSSRDYPEQALDEAGIEAFVAAAKNAAPLPPPPSRDKASEGKSFETEAKRLLSFFASYYATFGPLRAEIMPLWPPLGRMTERLGWDEAKLNAFLAGEVAKAAARRAASP